MIRVTPSDVGRAVVYAPYVGGPIEVGEITSYNESYIFVRFGNELTSKACYPRTLNYYEIGPPKSNQINSLP